MSDGGATDRDGTLRTTPLDSLHRELDAKMVPFAGYRMPLNYPTGIVAEHTHTRSQASLFDISHMGQVVLLGADAAERLETLLTGDITGLEVGRMRYTLMTDESGGILDDVIVVNGGDRAFLVVNAARKTADVAHMRAALGVDEDRLHLLEDRAFFALQGPAAEAVMARFAAPTRHLPFLNAMALRVAGVLCYVTRSGYTGEDGFEVSVPVDQADHIARFFLDEPEVRPAGLGARDTLRLEAGLCLYGRDIDETTTPVEAGLSWAVGKRRREAANFPGAEVVLRQIREGAPRRRVGLRPEGRAVARPNDPILDTDGRRVGHVTSGSFGPTVGGPVAMGYVETALATPGQALQVEIRGRSVPATVVKLPFVEHRYYRG